jgi:phosphoglycolate phosphatase-like HAD superfamily hydrolase
MPAKNASLSARIPRVAPSDLRVDAAVYAVVLMIARHQMYAFWDRSAFVRRPARAIAIGRGVRRGPPMNSHPADPVEKRESVSAAQGGTRSRSVSRNLFAGLQAVLLDIDGTLVDSNGFHVRAWDEAFRQCSSRIIDSHAIHQQIGKGADQLVPALVPDADAEEHTAIAHAHDEIFRSRYLSQVRPFDDAGKFVARLSDAGIKVVLASSAKRAEVDHYIQLLGIKQFLQGSTCADDVLKSKPAADVFVTALGKLDSPRLDRTLVIGDTPYDAIAAAKCGIATLGVLSGGFSEPLLRSAGCIAVLASVSEVLETM